ncbi:unnamed protein product [Peronospora effusa]|nr:unnamed protein product [Peronospora effusa]
MAWRSLMTRVKCSILDAYVPFRVMLDMDEESKNWGRALGTKGPCTSVVAGFVLKQQTERLSKFSNLLDVTDIAIVMTPRFRDPVSIHNFIKV